MSVDQSSNQIIRMKKRKQFLHVAEQGTKVIASGMVVQVCSGKMPGVRIGFTVTKKVGCAVVRNRVRRRLREVVRLSPDIDKLDGYDLVFIGRQSTEKRPFNKLKSDLSYILHQIIKGKGAELSREKKKGIKTDVLVEAVQSVLTSSFTPEQGKTDDR